MDQSDSRQRRRRVVAGLNERLALARRRLLRQASVFDDPSAYAAGVEDAFAAIGDLAAIGEMADDRGSAGPPSSTIRGAVG